MNYLTPTNLMDALACLQAGDVTVIAGGTDHFPSKPKGAMRGDLLDITGIDDVRGFRVDVDGIRIGAATTWSEIANTPLPNGFETLQQAAREVGGLQIQNAGTIGGNICNASPAADGVPPLLALDANVEIHSASGKRQIPLQEFLAGPRMTTLEPGELVVAIHAPHLPPHVRSHFEKLGSRRYLVISISMVSAIIGLGSDGCIDFARVTVGACSPVARRLSELETDLIGQRPDELAVTERHLQPLDPLSDIRGSADFRNQAVAEQIRRAILNAVHRDD